MFLWRDDPECGVRSIGNIERWVCGGRGGGSPWFDSDEKRRSSFVLVSCGHGFPNHECEAVIIFFMKLRVPEKVRIFQEIQKKIWKKC